MTDLHACSPLQIHVVSPGRKPRPIGITVDDYGNESISTRFEAGDVLLLSTGRVSITLLRQNADRSWQANIVKGDKTVFTWKMSGMVLKTYADVVSNAWRGNDSVNIGMRTLDIVTFMTLMGLLEED